jgi:malonyl-CoA O-methyltransferase
VLDKRRIRAAFGRAAPGFEKADFLHRDIRDRLLNRLHLVQIQPERILDLGAGGGAAAARLAASYPGSTALALDSCRQMLASRAFEGTATSAAAICADAARLPLADASIDLIFSNLLLHHCPDLDAVLSEMRRVLRFPGLLIFSSFGPDTLIELRKAWAAADDHSHVSVFMDMHDMGDALIRAGFAEPVLDVEQLTVTYENLARFMQDLRSVGSINATDNRNPGLTSTGRWQRMVDAYETFRNSEGRLPATLEIVFAVAWSADPGSGARIRDGAIEIPLDTLKPRGP